MEHPKLFIGMGGLLIATAGGVFVLVSQGNVSEEYFSNGNTIQKKDFVAGVSVEHNIEVGLTTENRKSKEEAQSQEIAVLPVAPQGSKEKPKPSLERKDTVPQPILSPLPMLEAEDVVKTKEANNKEAVASNGTVHPNPDPVPQPPPVPQPAGKININTAHATELQTLNGVGPVLAGRIIEYRNTASIFYTVEDIKKVKGIGEITFRDIQDSITVGNVLSVPRPQPPLPPVLQPVPVPPPPEPIVSSGKININTADREELQAIVGVGEVIARRIIEYRNSQGLFMSLEDIKNVKGIGDVKFKNMQGEIKL